VDESASPGTGFLADLCRQWEAATHRASESGARVVLPRIGHVLSRRGGLLGTLRPVFLLGLGGRLGSGRQYMPWIHLTDTAAGIRFLLEHGSISGPVNLCAPRAVTNAELTAAFGRSVHRPAPWMVPRIALRLVLGEATDEILLSQRTVPKVLRDNGFEYRFGTLDAALADLAGRGVASQA